MLRESLGLTDAGSAQLQARRVLLRAGEPGADGAYCASCSSWWPRSSTILVGRRSAARARRRTCSRVRGGAGGRGWSRRRSSTDCTYGAGLPGKRAQARRPSPSSCAGCRCPSSGKRDLSDLTSTIMKDCADQERMFIARDAAAVRHGHIHGWWWRWASSPSTGGWASRRSGRCRWRSPSSPRLSRAVRRKVAAKEERRLAMADGVQEYLDCAQRNPRDEPGSAPFSRALGEQAGRLRAVRRWPRSCPTGVTISSGAGGPASWASRHGRAGGRGAHACRDRWTS